MVKSNLSEVIGGENPFSPPSMPKTFAGFLQTDTGKATMDGDFHARIAKVAASIKTLTALKNYARERYPEQYVGGWRENTSAEPYGKETMGLVWAAFKRWSEA